MPAGFQSDAFQNDAFDVAGTAGVLQIIIDGTDRTDRVRVATGLDLTYTLGGRAVCRCQTVDPNNDSTASAYTPDIDETFTVVHDAVDLFTGRTLSKTISALGEPAKGVVAQLDAIDFSSALDHRLVHETYAAADAWPLKGIIEDLETKYLSDYGITVDPGMATGPTISADVIFNGVTIRAALNYLSTLTGWPHRISPLKVLEMFAVGTEMASFSLSTAGGNLLGGVTWRKERTSYVNRVTVRFGGEKVVNKRIGMVGDGVTTTFPLDYTPVLTFTGAVVSSGVVVEQGNLYYPLYGTVAGVTWTYDEGSNSLVRTPALPAATEATWDYAVHFPEEVSVEDAAEIASLGIYEARVDAPDIVDRDSAEDLADAILAQSTVIARRVTVRTFEGMAFPGDVINLSIADRDITGDWLIIETRVRDFKNDTLQYEFTCLEGSVAQLSWVDYLRQAFGGGAVGTLSGGTLAGAFAPGSSGFFTGDVIAHTGMDDSAAEMEVSLRGRQVRTGVVGPGLVAGRLDSTQAWAVLADHLAASAKGLYFVALGEASSTHPYVLALTQDPASPVAGEYHLIPYVSKKLTIGGDPNLFGGHTYRIEDIFARDGNFQNGVYERGYTSRNGEWVDVAFNAANYTASGSMTWTVASGNIDTHGYTITSGKWLEFGFAILNTSVGGTLSNLLHIAIPGGYTAAKTMHGVCRIVDAGGTQEAGAVGVVAGGTTINIAKMDSSNFTATGSPNFTSVRGHIAFPIQ